MTFAYDGDYKENDEQGREFLERAMCICRAMDVVIFPVVCLVGFGTRRDRGYKCAQSRRQTLAASRFVVYPYRLALARKKENIKETSQGQLSPIHANEIRGNISPLLTQTGELVLNPRKYAL